MKYRSNYWKQWESFVVPKAIHSFYLISFYFNLGMNYSDPAISRQYCRVSLVCSVLFKKERKNTCQLDASNLRPKCIIIVHFCGLSVAALPSKITTVVIIFLKNGVLYFHKCNKTTCCRIVKIVHHWSSSWWSCCRWQLISVESALFPLCQQRCWASSRAATSSLFFHSLWTY